MNRNSDVETMDEESESRVGCEPVHRNIPLRMNYRELLSETQKHGLKEHDVLVKSFEKGEQLFSQVMHPQEAIYDARLVNMQSIIVKQRTESLHSSAFDPEEFGRNIVNMYRRQRITGPRIWKELGKEAKMGMTTTPAFHFMYGTFEPEAVELKKKVRKEREKDELGKIQKPKLVAAESTIDSQSSTEVERVFSILTSICKKQNSSVSYFEFVLNPHSFAETIENMFNVAVLVKEGAVRIFPDMDNHPFIDPILDDFQQKKARSRERTNQAIFSITMQEWKRLIEKFNITKPRIVPRARRNETPKDSES